MALVKCKECKHEISKSAESCQNCGAKAKKSTFISKFILSIIIIFSVFIYLGNKGQEQEKARLEAMTPEQIANEQKVKEQNKAKEQEESERLLGLRWSYSESDDKMGRGKIKTANLSSTNEVNFKFPYSGEQRGKLQLRIHPEYGKDVILSIEKGQFLCGVTACSVQVRFGDGKTSRYSATEPADHSTTTLFIGDYSSFITNAKKVNKIYIEAQFFQEGTRVFEFNTSDLKWP